MTAWGDFEAAVACNRAVQAGEPAEPFDLMLRDGTRATLRPIRPDDRDLLVEGLGRLSSRSRYLRFHAPIRELSDAQLRYFTEIDHCDHVAWIALDADDPGHRGMGVARYIRLDTEPHVAEAAITVADDCQGKGLGTVLMGLLAAVARANDVEVFRNYVLDANAEMLELFDELGADRTHREGVWEVDWALPRTPTELPNTPAGRAVQAVAAGRIRSGLLTHVPKLLSRGRKEMAPRAHDPPQGQRERGALGEWVDEALESEPDPSP